MTVNAPFSLRMYDCENNEVKYLAKMKFIFAVGLILMSGLLFAQNPQTFMPTFKEEVETTHKIPEGQEFTFGYLEVLENRQDPNSRTIEIPIYIFRSRSENPKPDPIIYTVGGPGSTTMPSAQYMRYYKYLDDRDLILFEQRGNYFARPHLDCPEWSKAIYISNLPNFDETRTDSLFIRAARDCRARLVDRDIDLNGYHTNEIAADIADLVEVLGIQEYNLLTMSYSTKIAQVLLRDYPQGIRSVVMDSPLPLEVSYDEESVANILSALDKLFLDCENQMRCNEAYPRLRDRFFQYLVEKSEVPLGVQIDNPSSGSLETFMLTGKDLITVFTSASTGNISTVPYEINKLIEGDLSSLRVRLAQVFEKPAGGAGIGMRLSVWCSEEHPFNDQSLIARETYAHPELTGLSPAVFDEKICRIWKVSSQSSKENEPVKSDVPILLISGEYDSETPPKWARNMLPNLNHGFHLEIKGWKHTPTTNWGNQCAMEAANDFFNDPTTSPNPECLRDIVTPKFKVPD